MTQLTLAQANHILGVALDASRQAGYKLMVVLDASGHLKSAQREDEAICIAGVQAAGLQHA